MTSSALVAWPTSVPAVRNLDAYISAVNRMPMLTAEEEVAYARRLRDEGDLQAAARLVMSHLRLVVATARQYLAYGLPHADLIQEGNIGLMKAVRRFDPEAGVRLATYAMHWIKAEIHEFILRNWRMVKVATTKAQRKLFFNLRSLKYQLQNIEPSPTGDSGLLTDQQRRAIATTLKVTPAEVAEMEVRMGGEDVPLEPAPLEGEGDFGPIHYLSDSSSDPVELLARREREQLVANGIPKALDKLDPRSRRIIEQRWLNVNDDGSGGATLQELGNEFGVSAERIRQLEAQALRKMRSELSRQA